MAKKATKKKSKGLAFTKGKTTGLGVQQFWVKLFTDNAKAKKASRKTDEQLAKLITAEFPQHKTGVFQDLRKGKIHRVQQVRNRYNRGGLTNGHAPAVISHRYGSDGTLNDPIYSGKKGVRLRAAKGT